MRETTDFCEMAAILESWGSSVVPDQSPHEISRREPYSFGANTPQPQLEQEDPIPS